MTDKKQQTKELNTDRENKIVELNSPPKSFYVIPNLVTTAGLFAGFYAIMKASAGHYEAACLAIYVAMIMDILDGRLARMLNLTTDFGANYDSMADMMSFGVAPALVIHQWSLHSLGKIGSLAAFVFIAFAALRLARFNTNNSSQDKRYFAGLASPAAAGLVISAMYVAVDYNISPTTMAPYMAILVFSAGLLMFSNVKYRSFKDFSYRDRTSLIGIISVVLVIAAIYFDPPVAFLLVGGTYFLSGLLEYVWHNRSYIKEIISRRSTNEKERED